MPRTGKHLLSEATIRSAKLKKKAYVLRDGAGLWLRVEPSGRKWWKLRVVFANKENSFSLGDYPTLTLAKAREQSLVIRQQIANGVDPGVARKSAKLVQSGKDSFESIAREWHTKFSPTWAESHSKKLMGRLELYVFPWIGKPPVDEIAASELLKVLRRIEDKGHLETAHRVRQVCSQVFRYAIQTGRAERDCAADLKGAIPPAKEKRFAAIINPKEIGALLRAIDEYPGTYVIRCALSLAPLVFLRPGELRKAEWSEFDLEAGEWRLPIERMKGSQRIKEARKGDVGHIVPLSSQAVEILTDLHELTGAGRYVFPGLRSSDRPISDAALTNALRRMGYSGDEHTVHGFRHLASTRLHELGFPSHLIEKQLAHSDRNKIRATYNHAEYLSERRKMMQAWSDYLDALKAGKGKTVVPVRKAG